MDKVSLALRELETCRNEDWHKDFIKRCLKEFQNIGWSTYECIERINNVKYSKPYGITKFNEFVKEDDLIINTDLIKLKAESLLQNNSYVSKEYYKPLIDQNIELLKYKNSQDKIMNEKISLYLINVIKDLNDFVTSEILKMIRSLQEKKNLTKDIDETIAEFDKNTRNKFKELLINISKL